MIDNDNPHVRALRGVQQNFAGVLAGVGVLAQIPGELVEGSIVIDAEGFRVVKRGTPVPDGAYTFALTNPTRTNKKRMLRDVSLQAIRSLTVESFEGLQQTCSEHGVLDQLKVQPWYEFARLMRNVLAHADRAFRFSDGVKANILPIQWRDKVISADMEGIVPDGDFYDWYDALELTGEMTAWAATLSGHK